MTGLYVARDIRMRIMPPVEAYNGDLFRDVLKAFDNLQERADKKADDFYNNYPGDEYTDMSDVADSAQEHSYSWWDTMNSLRQSMINLMTAGLYHLTEQQLSALSIDCGYGRVSDTNIDVVKKWYAKNLGIDLTSLRSWGKICELRCVANSVKHAEGKSIQQLRELRPDLFQNPAFADIRAEMKDHWYHRQEPLAKPLAGEDLFVTENDLETYSKAARSLFEDIASFCEVRGDDNFPLTA